MARGYLFSIASVRRIYITQYQGIRQTVVKDFFEIQLSLTPVAMATAPY